MQRLDDRSRMSGDVHVRFCERMEGRFLWVTRLVVLLHPKTDPQWIVTQMRGMLGQLDLELHLEKTRVTKAKDGVDFLGVHLRLCRVRKPKAKLKYSCRIWPSDHSMQRIRQKARDVIGRRYSMELEEMIKALNPNYGVGPTIMSEREESANE